MYSSALLHGTCRLLASEPFPLTQPIFLHFTSPQLSLLGLTGLFFSGMHAAIALGNLSLYLDEAHSYRHSAFAGFTGSPAQCSRALALNGCMSSPTTKLKASPSRKQKGILPAHPCHTSCSRSRTGKSGLRDSKRKKKQGIPKDLSVLSTTGGLSILPPTLRPQSSCTFAPTRH